MSNIDVNGSSEQDSQPTRLVHFGFYQLTKQKIKCKDSQRAALNNADEEAATKLDNKRHLNQKWQLMFPE